MITAKNIHKFFDDLHVLKGVDLHIKSGEIVSIVGPSGAGKTTLLQILGTLDKPSINHDPELILNENSIVDLNEKDLAKIRNEQFGFIFQFHQLLPEFTALENVCIPAFIKGTARNLAEKRALELLE
ncbi:MAG: ATP-binding cassette domain-containing protein, partial [Flavobacteriaceae bacterium]|nr:ATP-binding cassette domain-containing protein [Flavobacteriaceae bacterium]